VATALATLAGRHPRRILLAAGVLFLIAATIGGPVTSMLGSDGSDFQDPSSQNERTNRAVTAATHQIAYYNVVALLHSERLVAKDAHTQRALAELARRLSAQRGFQRSADYASTRSQALISRDGHETVLLAAFATTKDGSNAIKGVRTALRRGPASGLFAGTRVRFGGVSMINQELNELTTSQLARAELYALPFLLALSIWFFRGLIAALLPPLVGGL